MPASARRAPLQASGAWGGEQEEEGRAGESRLGKDIAGSPEKPCGPSGCLKIMVVPFVIDRTGIREMGTVEKTMCGCLFCMENKCAILSKAMAH